MKQKPLSIKLIALAYLLAPLGNILQIAYLNHWPFLGPRSVFYHLNSYEWCVLAMFPVVALGVFRVSRWGYFLFLAFAAFLICQNTYAFFASGHSYSPYIVTLFQLVTFGGVGFFVQKHVVAPYFNPKIRWWETDPRYEVRLVAIVRKGQTVMKGHLLDISETGCFLELDKELNLGDLIWVNVSHKDWHFATQTRVVWVHSKGSKFSGRGIGYGLMFTGLGKVEGKKLDWILKDLKTGQKNSVARTDKKGDSILVT